MSSQNQEDCFDYLGVARAIAAAAVVFNHVLLIVIRDFVPSDGVWLKQVYNLGGLAPDAVTVFFVISGFSITFSIERRVASGRWTFGSYLFDRLARLWIVLIPALVVGGIFDAIGRFGLPSPLYFGVQGTPSLEYDVATRLTLVDAIGSLAFLQTLLTHPFGTNGPLWSLANEFWYYVWFPALLFGFSRSLPRLLLAVFALVTMALFQSLLVGFGFWLLGSLAFHAAKWFGAAFSSEVRRRWLLLAGSVAWLVGLLVPRLLEVHGQERLAMVAVGTAFSVFALQTCRPKFPARWRYLANYGSMSSFSLYVCHFPFLVAVANFIVPDRPMEPGFAAYAIVIALMALMLAWGYVFSLATEHRTDWVKRVVRQRFLRNSTASALRS